MRRWRTSGIDRSGSGDLPNKQIFVFWPEGRNTWLAGKVKCGYALKVTRNPSGYEYLQCNKRFDHKGCPGCGTLRKVEFEQFIFTAMGEKFRDFKHLRGGGEKANPKLTAYQVELA